MKIPPVHHLIHALIVFNFERAGTAIESSRSRAHRVNKSAPCGPLFHSCIVPG